MEITPELIKQRIEIAQDVIASIKAETMRAKSKIYVLLCDTLPNLTEQVFDLVGDHKSRLAQLETNDLQAAVQNRTCEVCAVGSLIVSAAKLYDKIAIDEVPNIVTVLSPWFKVKELALMEYAFEGKCVGLIADSKLYEDCSEEEDEDGAAGGPNDILYVGKNYPADSNFNPLDQAVEDIYRYEVVRCELFYRQYGAPTERLLAIMENIVRNGGVFVPPKPEPIEFTSDDILSMISRIAESRGALVDVVRLKYDSDGAFIGVQVIEID